MGELTALTQTSDWCQWGCFAAGGNEGGLRVRTKGRGRWEGGKGERREAKKKIYGTGETRGNSALVVGGMGRCTGSSPGDEVGDQRWIPYANGAITSKIKHAIKYKTSPTRLAKLLQPSVAFCFSLQPMTAYRPVLDGTLSLAAS